MATRDSWGTHRETMKPGKPMGIHTHAMPLTAAQRAAVEQLGEAWAPLGHIPDVPPEYGNALGVQSRRAHGLYFYSSDAFAENRPPDDAPNYDEAAIIWDARHGSDEDARARSVPAYVRGAGGLRLKLRAMTLVTVGDYPVEQGDRVFIDMTEARARQIALADFDYCQTLTGPAREAADARVAECGGASRYQEMGAEWMLDRGLPDTAHVTSHWRDERERARAEHADAVAAAEALIDSFLSVLRSPEPAVDELHMKIERHENELRAVPPPGADPAQVAIAQEYMRVAAMLLRGDMATTRVMTRALRLDDPAEDCSMLKVVGTDHRDRKNNVLDPRDWAESQRHVRSNGYRYPVIYNGELKIPENSRFTLQFQIEYIGVHLHLGDVAEADIGAAFCARYLYADFKTATPGKAEASPWAMVQHWPIAEGLARGAAFMREFEADPQPHAERAFDILQTLAQIDLEQRRRDVAAKN